MDGDLAEGKIVCKFSTGGHSGVMVPVYAFGPGAEEFTMPEVTVPKFETEAVRNALEMSQYSVSELERLLRVNTKIAAENRLRFHDFCSEENRSMPCLLYTSLLVQSSCRLP